MINPNEAPNDLIAVPYVNCTECALDPMACEASCFPNARADGTSVMFAVKPNSTRARLLEIQGLVEQLLKEL